MKAIRSAFLAVIFFHPAVAIAQDAVDSEKDLASDAAIYARQYGVEVDEAKRRIMLMVSSQEEVAWEDEAEGDNLAAGYFDNGPAFRYVIETKGSPKPSKSLQIKVKGRTSTSLDLPIVYRTSSKISRNAIRKIFRDKNNTIVREFPESPISSYDERAGVLTLSFSKGGVPPAADERAAKLSKQLGIPVRVKELVTAETLIGMKGGVRPWRNSGTQSSPIYVENCTLGFAAQAPDGKQGYITAGHCVDYLFWKEPGGSPYQTLAKAIEYRTPSGDWQFVYGVPVDRLFKADNSGSYRTLTGRRTQNSTCTKPGATSIATGEPSYTTPTSCQGAVNGTFVCWYGGAYGPANGQQCGEVNANWVRLSSCGPETARVPCDPYWVEVVPKAGAGRFYAGPGDSGGPVFAWNTAFGIMTNSDYYSDGSSYVMWYTSTDDIYSFNYSLLY